MSVKFSNNAATTLSSGINASTTSIPLTDGSAFPALGISDDYAYVTIADSNNVEVVKAISRSGNTLTVIRGQDDTTAASFASGEKVELRVTAAALNDIAEKYASYKLLDVPDGNYIFTGNTFITSEKTVGANDTWTLIGDATVTVLDTTVIDGEIEYIEESGTLTGSYVFSDVLYMIDGATLTLGSNSTITGFETAAIL